ncbi:MAG: EAL domain-containing protein, partial [Actinobacteria bacterium]|nr:EAL domain-containing protein [Actinomycetota bacterium]
MSVSTPRDNHATEVRDGRIQVASVAGVAFLVGAILLYLLAVPLARLTVFPEANVALFWFPIAIFAGLIARLPLNWLPALTVSVLVAEFIGTQVFEGVSIQTVWLWMLAAGMEAVLVGLTLKAVGVNRMRRPVDLLKLAVVVPVVVLASAAVGGLAASTTFGSSWLSSAQAWWLGDVSGLLIMVPFVLAIRRGAVSPVRRFVEYLATSTAVVAISLSIFLGPVWATDFSLKGALFVPMLGWIALRFGVAAVASIAPLVVFIGATSAAHSVGQFEGTTPDIALLLPVQGFLLLTCLTAYAVGTVAEANWRAEALLRAQASEDALTGLPNRRAMLEQIQISPKSSRKLGFRAILFCDLRDFKQVNDTAGHDAGDEALIVTASRLAAIVSDRGTVARFGGDEFVVLLNGASDQSDVADLARDLVASVGQPIRINGNVHRLGLDVGIAIESEETKRSEQLPMRADMALLEAKREMEPTTKFYAEAFNQRLRANLDAKSLVRNALQEGQVEAWFQPIFGADAGLVVGAEALARIRTSDGTVHKPSQFIEVAEQTGLIVELGQVVLEQSLDWARQQRIAQPGFLVSVNVSVRQLDDVDFADKVVESIARRELDPSVLILEVTEQMMLGLHSPAMKVLASLRSHGVRIAIDDFGTGYASFTGLRRTEADVIK